MEEQLSNNSINYEVLAQAVQKERAENPEVAHKSDKEILSSILARHAQEVPSAASPAGAVAPAQQQRDDSLPSYAAQMPDDAKVQVEHLVALTLEKGIGAGMAHAKSLDPFAMDAFHDALSEKLISVLKEKQLL